MLPGCLPLELDPVLRKSGSSISSVLGSRLAREWYDVLPGPLGGVYVETALLSSMYFLCGVGNRKQGKGMSTVLQ